MIKTKLHNVVCSGSVGKQVALDVVASLPGAEYDPDAFPGVRFRMSCCTAMLFATGKANVVGAPTEDAAYEGMDMLIDMLKQHDVSVGGITRNICNVVMTAKVGRRVSLERVVMTIPRSLYEPENFSGVILRRQDPKCTMLLFASGSIVCVGAKSADNATVAINQLVTELEGVGAIATDALTAATARRGTVTDLEGVGAA